MASDRTLEDRVRVALENISEVSEKRMFGSLGFMVRGKLCVTARAERLMCRIDPVIYDGILKQSGCQPVVMKGRERRGYVYVNSDVLTSDYDLKYWIDLALEYNGTIT